MLLNKLISVITLIVVVFAQSDSEVPQVRSKRTIGVVLQNVGGLFGFDVFKRPPVPPGVPAAASTLTDNVRKSFTININWNKNRTQANLPAAAPAAAPAPAAPRPAPAPAAKPAAAPGAKPAAAPAAKPAAAPAPKPVPAAAGLTTPAPVAPPRPSGPPTKAQLYVEYIDTNPKPQESQEKEEEEEEEDDSPKRIQIGLPDYSSVDYNEVKRDLVNQGNNDFDHSKEKFKQEFNNFWESSPWTVQHGYRFIIPQGPDAAIVEAPKETANYQEFELPKNNNVRSLKIVHNVKVYRQPTKSETYNEVDSQNNFYPNAESPLQQLHIVDEEGVRYMVQQNGKKMPLPTNINALILEYFKRKFQADAEAQRRRAQAAQNAIHNPPSTTTPAPTIYKTHQSPIIYVPPDIVKKYIEDIKEEIIPPKTYSNEQPEINKEHHVFKVNHEYSSPKTYSNEQPEIKEERHIYKVNHYRNDDAKPHISYGEEPETIKEPEYLDIKEKVEAEPHQNYAKVDSHANLNSYIANARPGQVVNIKIVEPSRGADFDVKRHGYGDSDDVHRNVEKEKEEIAEKDNKDKTLSVFPGFNYKEFEKVGYPHYDDQKDQDFFPGFSEEEKKKLEDHYHFFSSDHDPRGRDKGKTETEISDKYNEKESVNKKEYQPDEKIENNPKYTQNKDKKESNEEKEDIEDDEEESENPQNIQNENTKVEEEKADVEDDDEDDDDHPQAVKNETEADDEEDKTEADKDESNSKIIQNEADNNEDEDDHSQKTEKNVEAEEDDDDDEEEVEQPLVQKETITEENDEVEDEDEENRQTKQNEEISEETEEVEDDEEEAEQHTKQRANENLIENDEDVEHEDEESKQQPKASEKENIKEEEDEEDEVENDDEETKQRPKIVFNNIKENFEVEHLEDLPKPLEAQSELKQKTSSQNEKSHQNAEPTEHNDENFVTDLNSFINSHFKDTRNRFNERFKLVPDQEKNGEETKAKNEIIDRLKSIENAHEKEFDDLFSKFGDGVEYEDFYKQFHRDSKFIPSKQNLIDSQTKKVPSKDKSEQTQQPDSSVVQPLYSGVLHAPAVQELFKSDKPLTVPFDHDYSASEAKSRSTQHRTKRDTQSSNHDDEEETAINEFKDESQYVPDTYTLDYNFEVPEPKMPDFAKLEAKQYKDDDTLSPNARVTKAEDGQKTTWISIKVPVTYTVDSRT